MKKSIFLFFAAILCAMTANAWGYKTAAGSWGDCSGSTSKFKNVTMNSGISHDVVMLKDVGDGLNILQNECDGQALYCKWTKASGDIFRGTARWNNGLYCDETVVIPEGKVYIKVGSGEQVQMTAGADYTYTADVTISTTGESYTISGGTVSGATINNESDMPASGKPASLTMSNSYTSKKSGNVHIVFDLKTNKVTETADSEPEPEPVADVTVHFINSVEWAAVACHHWVEGGSGTSWPGDVLSKTDEIAGYDVYTATFTGEHTSCIFNNNDNAKQTGDLTVENGKYYEVNTNTWYADKAAAEAALAIPIPDETVYLINTGNWSKAMIHTWNGVGGTAWPGVEMTLTGETIEGYDVYSYTAKQGGQANLLFQESENVNKTGDLTWEAGKYYAPLKNEWYDTKEAAAEALAAPVEYEYVYLINTNDWAAAHIYTWTPEVAGWPGAAMTKEAEQIAGKDVYSYKVVKGTTFGGLNFNCGGDECKTGDLEWQVGKYYAHSTGEWYADAAAAEAALAAVVTYDYYIAGTENLTGYNWKENGLGMIQDGELYKAIFDALPAGEFEFKVTNGTWTDPWGYNNLSAAYEEVSEGTDGEGNPNGNIKFVTEEAKNITVIFDPATGKITIDGLTEKAPVVLGHDYYITGSFNENNPADEDHGMSLDGEVYKATVTLAAGDNTLKVTKGSWDPTWGYNELGAAYEEVSDAGEYNNIKITLAAEKEITVIFDATAGKITFENLTEKAPEPTFAYYITGSFNGDDPKKAENGMTLDGTVYKATVTLAEGDNMLKVTDGTWENTWGYGQLGAAYEEVSNPNDGYNNIKITLAAEKEITVIFDATAGKITFDGLTEDETETLVYDVEVPAGTEKCYIVGKMNNWEFEPMTQVDATHWTITYDNVLKTTEYKYACQASWDYVEKDAEGNDVANRTWKEGGDEVAKWGVPPTYTIVGATAITGVNWDPANEDNKMTKDGEVYTLTKTDLQLEAGDYEYKVAKNGAWGDGEYPAEGNQKVTIEENGVYTIVYTYTVGTSLNAEPTKTGDYTPEKPVYTVAGDAALCGTNWDAGDTDNDMTDNGDGTFTWTKTDVTLTSDAGFKVVKNHDFGTAYPAENWVINPVNYEGTAIYTVTITFTESSQDIAVTLTKTGDAAPAVISYVLMGVNGDWTTGIPLTVNPDDANEYVLTDQVIIKATDAIKVVTLTDGEATAWCGNVDSWSNATYTGGGEDNIVLEDGIYTFYFKKTANNIYINQTGYARNVTNTYGTICLPYAAASTTGAIFYRVAGKETGKVYLESVDALEAGVPYIFEKTASQITVVYTGDPVADPVNEDANGLVGTFTDNTVVAAGDYILLDNELRPSDGNAKVNANRAYLVMSEVSGGAPQQMPGRRYIGMRVQGENETTGLDNITNGKNTTIKLIENGQLIIIRGGEKFNAQGQKL